MNTKEQSSNVNVTSETSLLPVWRRINQTMAMRLSRHDIPLSMAVALLYIHQNPESNEPALLADHLMLPRQTMTSVLDAMERDNYAHRLPHLVDRRRKIIQLTDEGHKKAQIIIDDLVAFETEAAQLAFTTREMVAFRKMVLKIADNLERLNSSTPDAK